MRRLVGSDRLSRVLFCDEEIFIVQPVHNRQNRRQLLKKGQQRTTIASTISRSHFPAQVTAWAGICAYRKDGACLHGARSQNQRRYQQYILRDVLEPWRSCHSGETEFSLKQDANSTKSTIAVCEEVFPGFWSKDIWASNPPHFNPMDVRCGQS
ncbi:unnamed protein product [Heligmosomoides polygyrus]|uniref:Transposase n=1 Tax=Heligmosomoides polygyrus TaxID=6339 RepID=A0A183GLP7_HELPZ|nr:unnamed protein product [Heligmosomoides polygyrus]